MPIDIELLERAIAAQRAAQPFSGVILIRESGQTRLAQASGLANRAEGIANTLETRFGIASGAKTFTALAVCQLVARGRAAFETSLKDCLGVALPGFDPAITLHHLLTHTAGIPDYFDEEAMGDWEALWKDRPMYGLRSPSDFLPMFQNLPMQAAPGARWAYNNAGYILLGLVVEHLSGLNFHDYIQTNIFDPAGMTDSGYFAMDRLPARTAYGYIEEAGGGWRTDIYAIPIIGGPDGGAFTTAPDLARFWDALLGGRLLAPALAARMLSPHHEAGQAWYGYGVWLARQAETVSRIYMLGEDPGVACYSAIYPERDLQVSLLGNSVPGTWPMRACLTQALEAA